MTSSVIISLLFIHWIADFVLQLPSWADTKWYNLNSLKKHCATYGAILFGGLVCINSLDMTFSILCLCFIFAFTNTIFHYLFDYYSSKWLHALFVEKRIHDFFVVMDLDQMSHICLLILSYNFFFN